MPMREIFAIAAKLYGVPPDVEDKLWHERLALFERGEPFAVTYRLTAERAISDQGQPDAGRRLVHAL